MKTEFKLFFKSKNFYIPILVLFCIELLLRTGMYKPFLKKNSYAANINNILGHAIEQKQKHNPDIILLGTSVAYQGLNIRLLQEKINQTGYKIQTAAIPGSELIVQDLVVEKILEEFDSLKLIIYVGEITMPWVSQKKLSLPTLAMLGEFNRKKVFSNLTEFDYESDVFVLDMKGNFIENSWLDKLQRKTLPYKIDYEDWAYLLFDTIKYRRDIGHLLVNPSIRIRYYKNKLNNPNVNFYEYENIKTEKMSSYNFQNLDDCFIRSNVSQNFDAIPIGSDYEHKKAIYQTCALSKHTTTEQNRTKETELYFKRLSSLYEQIKKRNIKIINIFAPYSKVIDNNLGGNGRVKLWQEELKKLNGQDAELIDFRYVFDGKNSDDFCYDVIHLNGEGAKLFSEELGNFLSQNLTRYIKK